MDHIQKLKFQHGRLFKVVTPITKIDVYFRLISKNEYDNYIGMAPNREIMNLEAEDYLLSRAIVAPPFGHLEDSLLAGEYHTIAEAIVVRSGFHELSDFVNELKAKRLQSQTLIEQIMGFICKAFPIYTIQNLEDMTYTELARLLALSETMMGIKLEVPGAEVPEPIKQAKPGIMKKPDMNKMSDEEKQRLERTRNDALEALKASRNRRQF